MPEHLRSCAASGSYGNLMVCVARSRQMTVREMSFVEEMMLDLSCKSLRNSEQRLGKEISSSLQETTRKVSELPN